MSSIPEGVAIMRKSWRPPYDVCDQSEQTYISVRSGPLIISQWCVLSNLEIIVIKNEHNSMSS